MERGGLRTMTMRKVRVEMWVDMDCKFCRETLDTLEATGKKVKVLDWPQIKKGYAMVIVPDHNAPSPGRPDGVLTHYHLEIINRSRIIKEE